MLVNRLHAVVALLLSSLFAVSANAQQSLTQIGVAYTQNFDTLANTGTSSTLPTGWQIAESGTNANTTYTAGTGSGTTGDTYSFGSSGSTDRALGSLLSGSLTPLFGACFANNTGNTITRMTVAYTGEEWRLGTASRTDALNFSYATGTSSITSGTYTAVAALNFTTPVTTTTGAKDGNAAANRTAISSTITSLSIANGTNFCIKWTDTDASGADDGLAVDDFSLTPLVDAALPTATGTATAVTAGSSTTFAATITAGTNSTSPYAVACNLSTIGGSNPQAFSVSGTSASFTYSVPSNTAAQTYSIACTVTDAQSNASNFNISLAVSGASLAPTATGSASPSSVAAGSSTTFSATAVSGTNPASSTYTVSCNLSAIGGSNPQAFSVSGTAASFSYTVPSNTSVTSYNLPCTVGDDQSRSSTFNIALTVTAPPPVTKLIYEINGSGTASPLAGTAVATRGIVTAVRGTTGSTKGFYIESATSDRDSDVNTSEGLLVFIGSASLPACAVVGNSITIQGTVQDFIPSTSPVGSVPLTELASTSNCTVVSTNQLSSLPAAVTIDSTVIAAGGSATQARKYLGMRVTMGNSVVVGPSTGTLTESTAQATTGSVFFTSLSGVSRAFRTAGILATNRPSDAANTVPSWNGNPEVFRIDTTGLTTGSTFELAVGTTISSISGIMDFDTADGQYQIYTNTAGIGTISPSSPSLSATAIPTPLPSDLLVVNANLERFFNDQNDGNGNSVTLSSTAYQGRLNKVSLAFRNILKMPDIVIMEEVEGPGPTDTQTFPVPQDIVNKINSDAAANNQGTPNYGWCQGVTNDVGQISVSIIYRQDRVSLVDCTQFGVATTYSTPGGGTSILNDRPPVVLRVNAKAPGSDSALQIRVVGNHLRSLNGIDQPGTSNGDRVRAKRNEQAKYLANLLTGNLSEQNSNWNTNENLLVSGDMNAFDVNDGYVDVVNCFAGSPAAANQQYFSTAESNVSSPCTAVSTLALTNLTAATAAQRYSYSFSGTAQRIDHILVNNKLNSRVRQFTYARNNADFPEGATYRNDFTRPERYSDHDMPAVYLKLPVEVTSRTQVNASPVVLNRGTGRYNGTITVTNTGAAALTGPVYVFFNNLPTGVTLPDLPTSNGIPYATINLPSGLAPGATSAAVSISFADPTNARISYTTKRYDVNY